MSLEVSFYFDTSVNVRIYYMSFDLLFKACWFLATEFSVNNVRDKIIRDKDFGKIH